MNVGRSAQRCGQGRLPTAAARCAARLSHTLHAPEHNAMCLIRVFRCMATDFVQAWSELSNEGGHSNLQFKLQRRPSRSGKGVERLLLLFTRRLRMHVFIPTVPLLMLGLLCVGGALGHDHAAVTRCASRLGQCTASHYDAHIHSESCQFDHL